MDVHKNARSCRRVEPCCSNESPNNVGRCARRRRPPVSVIAEGGNGSGGRFERSRCATAAPGRIRSGRSKLLHASRSSRYGASGERSGRWLAWPGVSVSTAARVCRREGLNRLRSLEPAPPPVRYERANPGELLHLDTKALGRFDRPGHRITRKRSFGSPRQGFEVLYVAADDASRLSYCEILPDERGDTASAFFTRALSWFARMQIGVDRVMTDNGAAFVSHAFRHLCASRAIRHIRTRPYTPRTNGKVEADPDLVARVGLSLRIPVM